MKRHKPYPEAYTSYMLGMFRYLKRQIYHGEYESRLEFLHSPIPDEPGRVTHADITVDSVYLYFYCRLAPDVFEKWKKKEYRRLGEIVLHEVCHILTDPLWRLAKQDAAPSQLESIRQINERQTQRICNVVLSYLPKDWFLPETIAKTEP